MVYCKNNSYKIHTCSLIIILTINQMGFQDQQHSSWLCWFPWWLLNVDKTYHSSTSGKQLALILLADYIVPVLHYTITILYYTILYQGLVAWSLDKFVSKFIVKNYNKTLFYWSVSKFVFFLFQMYYHEHGKRMT